MIWENIFETYNEASQSGPEISSIVPLLDYRLIIVSGEDSETFLQGQCTCDFKRLEKNQILLGAHCTHKGRMISSFHAMRLDAQSIVLRVHASIAEATKDSLAKYAIFSKVTVNIDSNYALFAIIGDESTDLMSDKLSIPPAGSFSHDDNYVIAQHQPQQLEIWCKQSWLNRFLLENKELYIHRTNRAWQQENIKRGIAEVVADTTGQLLPQELNFQLVDGISFDKGCYTGQEIVARLHYRGKLKKHLYLCTIKTDTAPITNDELVSEQGKGKLINVVESGASEYTCLALCDDKLISVNSVTLEKNSAAKIQWLPLPYAITE